MIRRLGKPEPDPGLATIVAVWPKLPEALRAGIVAMVKAAGTSTP
ncbi:MAG TPA: hypothetical protein VMV69_18570 [Pirellulales bacterium]|nr:hypothetical protein [Pirellulales bacterium]